MFRRTSTAVFALATAGLMTLAACGSDEPTAQTSTQSSSTAPTTVASSAPVSSSESATSPAETTADSSPADTTADSSSPAGSTQPALPTECAPAALQTKTAGKLTIATSEPAYAPWMIDNDPTNGKGLESAVAYQVAERLGYETADVSWIRVGFDAAITPSPKDFDFDINQFTITPQRAEAVDFSSGYYDVTQTVITIAGSPIAGKTSLADLKDAKLGAMLGTTSLDAINATIAPTTKPAVFKDNALAAQALQGGQIDGLVVDLPTALYMTAAQLDDGQIVGQLPMVGEIDEQLGLVLEKDSPITDCVTAAVDSLRADGTLAALATEWIAGAADAPVLG